MVAPHKADVRDDLITESFSSCGYLQHQALLRGLHSFGDYVAEGFEVGENLQLNVTTQDMTKFDGQCGRNIKHIAESNNISCHGGSDYAAGVVGDGSGVICYLTSPQ